MIDPFLTTVWDKTYGGVNQYRFESSIYLLSYLALAFYIIIYISVVTLGNGQDLVDGMSYRDKQMLKLAMESLLNT